MLGETIRCNADATGMIILTHNPAGWLSNYDWSPDGQKIVFYWDYGLHVINADGTGKEILTRVLDYAPQFVWLPDGKKISLAAEDLYVINADGTGRRKLTQSGASGSVSAPSFSPDGEKIAFGMNEDVYVIGADGSGLKNLTHTTAEEYGASWSPSGEKIAFVRTRSGMGASYTVYDLYVMNTDGPGKTLVAKSVSYRPFPYGAITFPTFSPNGQEIAFARQANIPGPANDGDIYVADTDGTGERKLTDTPQYEPFRIQWRPVE